MSNDTTRRTVTFHKDAPTQDERAAARWRAKQILLFVGLPGVILAGASLSFNILFARQLGHDDVEKTTWTAVALAISLLISGLPIAIELLRHRDRHLVGAAIGLWVACFILSLVSATSFSFGTRSRVAAEVDAGNADRERLQATISRSEKKLAKLSARPTATVAGELQRAEVAVGKAFELTNSCHTFAGKWQRDKCAPVLALRTELAAAEDADKLEAKIAADRATLNGMGVYGESDAQGNVLVWVSGGIADAGTWRHLMSLFVAAIVEFGAAICLLITGKSIASLMGGERHGSIEVPEPQANIHPLEPAEPAKTDAAMAFQTWFASKVSIVEGSRTGTKEAHTHFEKWLALNNMQVALPYTTFGRMMSEAVYAIGGKIGKSNLRFYENVSLAPIGEAGMSITEEAGE